MILVHRKFHELLGFSREWTSPLRAPGVVDRLLGVVSIKRGASRHTKDDPYG